MIFLDWIADKIDRVDNWLVKNPKYNLPMLIFLLLLLPLGALIGYLLRGG